MPPSRLVKSEKGEKMDLNYFKGQIFDLLNESDELDISDIRAEDQEDLFTVTTGDGSVFRVICETVK